MNAEKLAETLELYYRQGYADASSDIRNKLIVQVHDILEQEKNNLEKKPMSESEWANISGWVECLEMIQHTLGVKK